MVSERLQSRLRAFSEEEYHCEERTYLERIKNSFMSENKNVSLGDSSKLAGRSNYYVWSLKMKEVLQREGWWTVTENQQTPDAFHANIGGRQLTK